MTWLHVPSTVLASAQASADLTSDSVPPLAPHIAQSVTWREKPFVQRSWHSAWKTGVLTPLRSGLTSKPSTLDDGVALWISSLRDIRASPSAPQANAKVTTIRAIFGRISQAISRQSSPPTSSARTSPATLPWGSNKSATTYKAWATELRQAYIARQKSELSTYASDSTFLPTPAACTYGSNVGGAAGRTSKVRYSFQVMAAKGLWPTPTVCGNYNRKGSSPKAADGLATAVAKHEPGPLNPTWVEWLMGYPIEWTVLEPLAMPSSRSQQPSHGRI